MVAPSLRLCSKHAYQKTLCLPKTKFPNRSNLQKSFDLLIPQSSRDVYQEQLERFLEEAYVLDPSKRADFARDRLFVLHDGPPYANGDLHLGHAMNKTLKDIINRYQLLKGKFIYYKPGWDCHGLPIELKALQKLGKDGSNMLPTKVRRVASQHAQKTINGQKEQFQQFAILTDWEDRYETMQKGFELNQLGVLKKMIHAGLIKRQNKPVYWGTETKTALAEGELEYNDNHISTSAYVKLPFASKSAESLRRRLSLTTDKQLCFLIWTSTPWTLFSNQAICFNEKFNYGIYEVEGEYIIVESGLKEGLLQPEHKAVAMLTGKELHNLKYTVPFLGDGEKPLIHGDHVTKLSGTGLVHTAPGHGFDDYLIGIANHLKIFSPVDNEGRYKLELLPQHLHGDLKEPGTGLPRRVLSDDTTKIVLNVLAEQGLLLKAEKYVHSYPYDWRSKKPVIIRATPQWFADLTDVKKLALESLKNVKFYPRRGETRLSSFIKSRSEWCISRQRSWGVPIPAFHKVDNYDEVLMNEEVVEHVLQVIGKKGIDSWFKEDNSDIAEWLPSRYKEVSHLYQRGKDTVDVWFDSGSTWNVLEEFYTQRLNLTEMPSPLADIYLEGSDQHRGWFQSSLLTKVATSEQAVAPYGAVITHGFTLDERGIKMSKSIGNTISPASVIRGDEKRAIPALGVDGLRLLISQADFTTDVTVGPTVMNHVAEALKKLRLTFKFLLGNLSTTEDVNVLVPFEELRAVDQFTICKLKELSDEVQKYYDSFNFSKVVATTLYHMNNQLSAFYFDIIKDSLYCDKPDSRKRRQIQTTLFYVLDTYRCILGPITPLLVQESWNYLETKWKNVENIQSDLGVIDSPFTRPWKHIELKNHKQIVDSFEQYQLPILRAYAKEFRALSNVTKTTQTRVIIIHSEEKLPFSEDCIADLLQVSGVKIEKSEEKRGVSVSVGADKEVSLLIELSDLHECPRCWKLNSFKIDSLCHRCSNAIT
ncbi:LAQU0S16e01090g1_1 [Lachancea quebecensis]|uniref:Isoleucine--tRNA ligase, mitochondrial n=1 Tax=Lachancea quebecensis TaxID=1654605 RepID=A0A0N7MM87_9SACH|nr:LAQU0S16e01090g1_1 [Lachancea quebecensis]